jgi:hypothetical protein
MFQKFKEVMVEKPETFLFYDKEWEVTIKYHEGIYFVFSIFIFFSFFFPRCHAS